MLNTVISIVFIYIFSQETAFAQQQYTLLVPLPGATGQMTQTTLGPYIANAFTLAIAIAAALAFVMITFGGITYATSDAITGKQKGRDFVTNAIYGLLLVIGAYAILYTINPNMLSFNLTLGTPSITPTTGTVTPSVQNVGGNVAGVPMNRLQIDADNLIRQQVNGRLSVYAGPCLQGQTSGCVNLNGLQVGVIDNLKRTADACNCDLRLTGGTEAGHSTGSAHNRGSAVDFTAPASLAQTLTTQSNPLRACGIYPGPSGGQFLWEPRGSTCGGDVPSSNDHWHVSF